VAILLPVFNWHNIEHKLKACLKIAPSKMLEAELLGTGLLKQDCFSESDEQKLHIQRLGETVLCQFCGG